MDYAGYVQPPPLFLTSGDMLYSAMDTFRSIVGPGITSGAWPAAFTIIYVPFTLPWPYPVRRLFCVNGAAVTGNFAVGIMSGGGARVYASASTAQGGTAATPQYVAPSPDFILSPNDYYFALQVSATTANLVSTFNSVTAAIGRQCGLLQETAGAMGIPAVMTPAQYASTIWPLVGITRTVSGY